MAWLVAGLGNPGDRYATSRHNLGRMVVDELARQERERFRKARFLPAEVAEIHHGGEQLLLVKSTHFMNKISCDLKKGSTRRGYICEWGHHRDSDTGP